MTPRPRHGRPRRRPRLEIGHLEARTLLDGAAATWIGQDGRDLVGPYPAAIPDGTQDVHIHIDGLPAGRTIVAADLFGLGGGHWVFNGPFGPWRAAVEQHEGASSADLYIQPDRVETGRAFNLILALDDGTKADLWFDGGTADPNLPAAGASLQVAWIGQREDDRTGPTAAVGPDGFRDVVLALDGLTPTNAIVAASINGPLGIDYVSGLNPQGRANAELVRDGSDPSRAELFFSPDRNLAGQTLTIEVVYATGRIDTAQVMAESTDPSLRVEAPPALPRLRTNVSTRWLGQNASGAVVLPAERGWVGLQITGLPAARQVVGATLSGATHNSWTYRAPGVSAGDYYADPFADTLSFRRDASQPTRAQVAFAPDRNLAGSTLTLRITFDDGSMAVVNVNGESVDLGKLSARPATSKIVVSPGVDLNALARQYGRIELSPGVYRLDAPLVLEKPITVVAPRGGVTLLFAQRPDDTAWTTAIKVHAGNTTLEGFSVRFEGPVRWDWGVSYGPSLIGTTDDRDRGFHDPKANLAFRTLDLQSPTPATDGEEAPRLFRLTSAAGGTIAASTLRGGAIEVLRGPWTIVDNTYKGTVPGTWAWDVIAAHYTHDLVVADNTVDPLPDSGRTWRFLVLTGTGDGDRVENNRVRGLGARADEIGGNADELVLTEAYGIQFEGRPLAVSGDGRIVQIQAPQGGAPGTGSVVAVLSGPDAGLWRRVAQVLSPTMLLLDGPLPSGSYDISIASGFVGETFRGNTFDLRGGRASGMVLVGNQYGTQVIGNVFLGGAESLRATAYPSESPVSWGWTHTSWLGGTISGNQFVDAARGVVLGVEHGSAIKSTKGRTYWSAAVADNTVRWTPEFLDARAAAGLAAPSGITVGDPRTLDPAELALSLARNTSDVPPGFRTRPAILVHAGTVNGRELVDSTIPLPQLVPDAPSNLALVSDTGRSDRDGLTSDGRIRFTPDPTAGRYEYRVGNGPYRPASDPMGFLPEALRDGTVTVAVRAITPAGVAGPAASLTFTLDTTPPIAGAPILVPSSDTGRSSNDGITKAQTLVFRAAGEAGDRVELLRDGALVASGSPGRLTDPGPLADGSYRYVLRRTDAAGNVSTSAETIVTIDTTPPEPVAGLEARDEGRVTFARVPDLSYQYRVGDGTYRSAPKAIVFQPSGLVVGTNRVDVRAIDAAGNVGPATSILVVHPAPRVSGRWIGQDGHDLVGPYPLTIPDGIQDIHIRLAGLPRIAIEFIDIQGLGGSRWQYGGPWGHWQAALVREGLAAGADLYIQPDRIESGRPFQVLIRFADGTVSEFWIQGGAADPSLGTNGSGGDRRLSAQRAGTPGGPLALDTGGPGSPAKNGRRVGGKP